MLIDFETQGHNNDMPPTPLRRFALDAINSRAGQTEYERYLAMPTAVLHPDGVIEIREEISGANQ